MLKEVPKFGAGCCAFVFSPVFSCHHFSTRYMQKVRRRHKRHWGLRAPTKTVKTCGILTSVPMNFLCFYDKFAPELGRAGQWLARLQLTGEDEDTVMSEWGQLVRSCDHQWWTPYSSVAITHFLWRADSGSPKRHGLYILGCPHQELKHFHHWQSTCGGGVTQAMQRFTKVGSSIHQLNPTLAMYNSPSARRTPLLLYRITFLHVTYTCANVFSYFWWRFFSSSVQGWGGEHQDLAIYGNRNEEWWRCARLQAQCTYSTSGGLWVAHTLTHPATSCLCSVLQSKREQTNLLPAKDKKAFELAGAMVKENWTKKQNKTVCRACGSKKN